MGEKIVPVKLFILHRPQKIWWKPWTWFAKPKFVEVAGCKEIEISFADNDEPKEDFLQ